MRIYVDLLLQISHLFEQNSPELRFWLLTEICRSSPCQLRWHLKASLREWSPQQNYSSQYMMRVLLSLETQTSIESFKILLIVFLMCLDIQYSSAKSIVVQKDSIALNATGLMRPCSCHPFTIMEEKNLNLSEIGENVYKAFFIESSVSPQDRKSVV